MDTSSKAPVPPPSPLEIQRKLSVHAKPKPKLSVSPNTLSGTESDSDSQVFMDVGSPVAHPTGVSYASSSKEPLQSIAERESASCDESDDDEDEEGNEWRIAGKKEEQREEEEKIVKSGYLWKKGSRRKTWKKRWFVLRAPYLAYYKNSAEYQLLRLLDLNEVHSVTPVSLKKHANTFGLVLPSRTLYLQAGSGQEVGAWVRALNDVRERLSSTTTIIPVPTPPIAIPGRERAASFTSGSPPNHAITSSDEEGPSHASPSMAAAFSPAKGGGAPIASDPGKVILSGYLMKCGKRKTWRKRWFILNGEKLMYCGNHMDTKHQRQIELAQILDAMEYDLPSAHRHPHSPGVILPAAEELADSTGQMYTFKIITTKRTLLLCAPSEEEEIRWLSAVRALIARRSGYAAVSASPPPAPVRGGHSRSITGGLVSAVEGVVGA
ncbi:hypothetical protein M422DRAFT_26849 [Sphaerobolus stellatus SS14]|nr:hypothetical protein M422DRAFT_26849 [Sphaerobolus stellatus SS14]